ncbi:MAG: hypothetical protein IT269_02460, partial [Saprospiraceae bacterium]|nr:hypothetical protein [Saprospiraceae bacterium]
LPEVELAWEDYYPLIKKWMNMIDTDVAFEHIYFNVTNCALFENIVNSKINSIELINIMGTPDPFGVKLNFEDDYIISMPISDGNTIETSGFHQHNNMDNFKNLGSIEFKKLNDN